jgi:asparagine synthase (glutamine-hydrolysing)
MCGIAGAMRLTGDRAVTETMVREMCDPMRHRGPDDAGAWVSQDARVGLGHRRLSIVDLSAAGHNPMPNEDGQVWITYNGEVYNHGALRPALEAAGHRYRSRTDTETLLHLYEEHGVEMLHKLRGMFAFAIWDEPRRRLFIARDRVGIKPLYYTVADGLLLWGSEIKALLGHPGVRREVDEAALVQYLTFAAVPPPATLFAGIHKLPPGHFVLVVDGELSVRRWWTPAGHPLPEGLAVDDEDAVATHIRELLTDAVLEETMADVPHGMFLSGGVDSSLILSILSRNLSRPVQTFAVGFENDAKFDERPFAAAVAKQFNAEHTELVLQPSQVMQQLPELVIAQDEPIADWVCLPLKLLARTVRDAGVIVVQVGEGSDELFAGYPRYRRYHRVHERYWRRYMRLPRPVRGAISSVVSPVLSTSNRMREPLDMFNRAARDEPMFISGAVANWDTETREMLTTRVRDHAALGVSGADVALRNLRRFHADAPTGDYAAAMAYQDFMVRLPELLLMRVDKMTMISSIEARVPFLDHRMVELGFALPASLKLKNGVTKYILKKAARPLLGDATIDRPKKGFDVPLPAWLREKELGGWAEDTVINSGIMRRDVLDREHVRGMFREHRSNRADHGFRIWNLVNLCAWHDHWIDRRGD